MFSQVFTVTLLCLGYNLVHCATTKNIEDADFLTEAASQYSPALVKSLLLNRIEHKIGQIKVVSNSVGINEKQIKLCNVMVKSFEVLKSDVQLMDETQVICGDDTYERTIKGFISQFATLTGTFNDEYEVLRFPDVTKNTPIALKDAHTRNIFTFNDLVHEFYEGVEAFIADIKDKETAYSDNGLIKILAFVSRQQLEATSEKVKELFSEAALTQAINEFGQIISVFYRQLGIISTPIPTEPTTQAPH